MKKLNKHKLFIFFVAIITISLLFFFFRDIIFEIIKFQSDDNMTGIKELLDEKGLIGCFMVVFVEALQMVIVVISAEFIQVSAGLTYPWYIAILLCDLGVFLGATIIYIFVNAFKFDGAMFKKSSEKIAKLSKQGKSIQKFMYFLFIMPIVPFGAICYYASTNKIIYRRYIITCVTGVIPSIITSIFIGKAISFAITESIPFWVVLLIAIGVIIVLLLAGFVFLNKIYLKGHENTPDSAYYSLIIKLYKILLRKRAVPTYDAEGLEKIDGQFVLLTNHPSFFDAYCATNLVEPHHPAFILNRYYFRNKIFRYILNKMGTIPKKLFSPDFETIKKTLKTLKSGYSIYMCPEGRLGIDGTNYYITKETGKFLKQLKLPIVVATINGAYLVKPKWRKDIIKGPVHTKITRIISKEEVSEASVDEINDMINHALTYNDFDFAKEKKAVYKNKNKAKGLENVLYYCPKCGQEFKLHTHNNTIACECGFSLDITEDYHFTENEFGITNIHDWYQMIVEYERENIKNGINLSCEVDIKKFNMDNKKLDESGQGKCFLTNDGFRYEGNLKVTAFEYDYKVLRALAFSCGEEFECYYDNELYYFYPKQNKQQCAKWALLVDELVKQEE